MAPNWQERLALISEMEADTGLSTVELRARLARRHGLQESEIEEAFDEMPEQANFPEQADPSNDTPNEASDEDAAPPASSPLNKQKVKGQDSRIGKVRPPPNDTDYYCSRNRRNEPRSDFDVKKDGKPYASCRVHHSDKNSRTKSSKSVENVDGEDESHDEGVEEDPAEQGDTAIASGDDGDYDE